MTKYSAAFRQEVITYYHSGSEGQLSTARRFGISRGALRSWLALQDSTSTPVSAYTPEFKYQVVTHMRAQRLSLAETCILFGIASLATLSRWTHQLDSGGPEALTDKRKRRHRMSEKTGKPAASTSASPLTTDEREELEMLRVEVAYLKKLDALLREKERQAQQKKRRR